MKCLYRITFFLVVLTLVESLRIAPPTKAQRPSCNVRCYGKHHFPVCGSDGQTYQNICELHRARCKLEKTIRIIKFGKCPVCQLKERPRCIVAGCFRPSCPAYPRAACISICGCDSTYYYRFRKVNCHPAPPVNPCHLKFCGNDGICQIVKGKGVCVSKGNACFLPKAIGPCFARLLRYFYNTKTRRCEPFFYGGCRGNRNNFATKRRCEARCKPQDPICPADKPLHFCFGPPCEVAPTCSAYPEAKCVDNYCGGCKADFYVDGKKVNCMAPQCPPPKKIHQCKVAPCDVTKCPAYPKAKCVNNYCGGCNAEFYVGKNKVNCNDVCVLPKIVGPCEALIPRYYFNSTTQTCEKFYYGGCQGNENNFDTIKECENNCKSSDVCSLPKEIGKCKGSFPRFYFNSKTEKCEKFIYGGCGGNQNNFRTLSQCNEKCRATDICSLRKVIGPCRARKQRYFYNSKTRKCEKFFYGGCRGNKNNFVTRKECENRCKPEDLCAGVRCEAGKECREILGSAVCATVLANPCIAATCLVGTKCIVVNGQARCVSVKPVHPLCATVTCFRGTKCVVENGKPKCRTPCSSIRDCKKQGSYCNEKLGICQCQRPCPAIHSPVCGSDRKRYSNICFLNVAACTKNTVISTVKCPRPGYYTKSG